MNTKAIYYQTVQTFITGDPKLIAKRQLIGEGIDHFAKNARAPSTIYTKATGTFATYPKNVFGAGGASEECDVSTAMSIEDPSLAFGEAA